jgi:peptidoglycan hydrolase-like protein with peptidoglycan-binding domain
VTSLTGNEPEHLELGDSGEGVLLLQVRLYQLRYYRQWPDSTYNMVTENAVRELQSALGMDNTGEVTRDTWEAILHLEQQYGIQYQFVSPYDALTQLQYDLEHPADSSGDFPAGDPSLSDDGQWRWNGTDWQAVEGGGQDGAGQGGQGQGGQGTGQETGQLSPDGQWRWDGYDWQPAQDGGSGEVSAGQLSEDGRWRWDGRQWQAAGAGDGYIGQLSEDGQWRWNGSQWQAA